MQFDPTKFFLLSGPCTAESYDLCLTVAKTLKDISEKLNIQLVFKASFVKANRSSIKSPRGPGIAKGLEILAQVKEKTNLPIVTDIHETNEVDMVSEVADILQIPAFLCRQTSLLEKAAATGKWVNIKKGQFMAPWDMLKAVEKVKESGKHDKVMVTERGTSFGYNNLVVDYRAMIHLLKNNVITIFDATHSVQLPSANGESSGGDRELALPLAKAAAAIGVNGYFIETHPDPDNAISDGPNSIYLKDMEMVIRHIKSVYEHSNQLLTN